MIKVPISKEMLRLAKERDRGAYNALYKVRFNALYTLLPAVRI